MAVAAMLGDAPGVGLMSRTPALFPANVTPRRSCAPCARPACEVARVEVRPDGTIVAFTGKPEEQAPAAPLEDLEYPAHATAAPSARASSRF